MNKSQHRIVSATPLLRPAGPCALARRRGRRLLLVAMAGRVLRKGVHFAGLGWADRLGGAALGTAEGLILGLLLVVGATWVLGKNDPAVAHSKSLEAYEVVRSYFSERGQELPDVATPGEWF